MDLAVSLAHKKRSSDKVTLEYKAKKFNAHLKGADKVNAKYFCVIGSNEMKDGIITIKNLNTKSEEKVALKDF